MLPAEFLAISSGGSEISGLEKTIASSRAFILDQWWVPTIPGVAIFVASLAFNLLGDGMRDVLDPRQR